MAAGLQPHFDPVADTISDLAAVGATDRWVMSLVFVLLGVCYIGTALALRPARAPGRMIMMLAGVAGILVAANPEHAGGFGSIPHFVWATIGFAGLTTWPVAAARRGTAVPWGLRPAVAAGAVAVGFALLAWFGAELISAGHQLGLAERALALAQAAWPLAVVVTCYLTPSHDRPAAT